MRASQGGAYERRGQFFIRITVGPQVRRSEHMPGAKTLDEALARARVVQALVGRLRAAGKTEFVERLVEVGATADDAKLEELHRFVAGVVGGEIVHAQASQTSKSTFKAFASRWTRGELHRLYPDVVRAKRTAHSDESRLDTHVYPVIGDRELASITIDDALEVLRRLPASLSPASRRHVAQLMTRILALAVYPCRELKASPLPRGFLPKLHQRKAKAALYPDEEAAVLACLDVPLPCRLLYGFVAREGMRSSEALRMTWSDLDLKRGAVRLDKNKTDDPRAWALDPGTAEALRRWRAMLGAAPPDALVFGLVDNRGHLADGFRAHLELAGVTRAELFEQSEARRRVRFHDLRATFVTVSLANDRTEAWVTARTGHRSSGQVATYRRLAQMFADVGAGWFAPMADAIPELRDAAAEHGGTDSDGNRSSPNALATWREDANASESRALGSTAERCRGSSPLPCTEGCFLDG
jgi:integrase